MGSKAGSLDNVDHKAGGGDKKIFDEKLNFKENAQSKVGSLPAEESNAPVCIRTLYSVFILKDSYLKAW